MPRPVSDVRPTGVAPDGRDPAQRPARSKTFATLLSYAAYPLLLAGATLAAVLGICFQFDYTRVNFLFLLYNFGYLALLERVIPFDTGWYPDARTWRRDGIYFVFTVFGGGIAQVLVVSFAQVVAPLHSALPLWAEIPLTLLLNSFTSYLFHRLQHVHPWLWRVHAIHHLPGQVNLSNNSVNHFLDVLCRRIVTQLPLFLLGISRPAIFVASIFTTAQGYFVHANINTRLGWLNYLVTSPEQHRLHHSTDPKEAGHYGVDLSIWDLLFRSFTWYPTRRPVEVGVQDRAAFPPTEAIFATLLYPFRRLGKTSRSSTS